MSSNADQTPGIYICVPIVRTYGRYGVFVDLDGTPQSRQYLRGVTGRKGDIVHLMVYPEEGRLETMVELVERRGHEVLSSWRKAEEHNQSVLSYIDVQVELVATTYVEYLNSRVAPIPDVSWHDNTCLLLSLVLNGEYGPEECVGIHISIEQDAKAGFVVLLEGDLLFAPGGSETAWPAALDQALALMRSGENMGREQALSLAADVAAILRTVRDDISLD